MNKSFRLDCVNRLNSGDLKYSAQVGFTKLLFRFCDLKRFGPHSL